MCLTHVQGEENCNGCQFDEKGMKRDFLFHMPGIPLGTFYRQRDFSLSVQGKILLSITIFR